MNNPNEENEEQEGIIDDQNSQDDNDFDSSSFLADSELPMGEEDDDEKNDDVDDVDDADDDDLNDDDSTWDMNYDSNDSTDDADNDSNDDDTNNNQGNENPSYEVLTKFKEIGVEASDMDDLLERVKGVLDERDIYQKGKLTNKSVESWKKALNLNDRELVRRNFIATGASEEDAEAMTASLESNDMLKTKSHDIRTSIRGSIGREQRAIESEQGASVARQRESTEKAEQVLRDHLKNTTTMFGFKMGKEENLDKIRKGHFDYIQSGQYFKDVTESEVSLSEAAWFQKNKVQIIKALKSKGIQTGKQEILNDINNATADESFNRSGNDGNSEFNPRKFVD